MDRPRVRCPDDQRNAQDLGTIAMIQALTSGQDLQERITDPDVYPASAAANTEPIVLLSEESGLLEEIRCAVPAGELVVSFEGAMPAWLEPTTGALADLLWLPADWDSYGAPPVDVDQARAVLELLGEIMNNDTPHPQLVPTNRGGVQVEWHRSGIDVEIETLVPGRFLVSYEDSTRDEESEWEQELASDWTRVSRVLARLS